MVVVLFQFIFLNNIKVYILLRSFAKQVSSRTQQITILTVHKSEDFHFLQKDKSQKDKFGLRPFEPSSFSSVAPRSLLPENFLLFDSSSAAPICYPLTPVRVGPPTILTTSEIHQKGWGHLLPGKFLVKILAPSSPLFSLLSRYPRFSILSNKCNPQQGWLTMFGF